MFKPTAIRTPVPSPSRFIHDALRGEEGCSYVSFLFSFLSPKCPPFAPFSPFSLTFSRSSPSPSLLSLLFFDPPRLRKHRAHFLLAVANSRLHNSKFGDRDRTANPREERMMEGEEREEIRVLRNDVSFSIVCMGIVDWICGFWRWRGGFWILERWRDGEVERWKGGG